MRLGLLSPIDLGIILSYQCQAGCKHCLYACGPRWKGWMTPGQVEEAIEVTKHWRHEFRVHLTGGEPFLNFELLLEAAKIVAARGVYQFVETNAGWCNDEKTTFEKLRELKAMGMNGILISCSPFQAEHIPLRKVLVLAKVACEVFGESNVGIYQTKCIKWLSRFGINELVPLERFVKEYGEKRAGWMFWHEYGLIGGGRASYRLGHFTQKFEPERFKGQNCALELLYPHHSHFDLYGNHISWFCGGLAIDRWMNLPKTVEEFSKGNFPPLVSILVHDGPYGLYELARDEYGYTKLKDGYANKCHLCVDVRGHLLSVGDFEELRPRQFYEML